ncbi:MAG: calcium/sodium antiporter [Candidatus Eisenbacteria bacterium]|nr:calcium/sodium antiporter [Candidatus Eisenbacteria bacterium]
MLTDLLLTVLGLILLIGGGEALVRGASRLARRIGAGELLIGLTVVAFGTSTPELAVNISAVLNDRSAMAVSNVVGSNLANIGLILGLCALLRPLVIHAQVVRREIPMMVVISAAALLLARDAVLGGFLRHFDAADGLILLLFFGIFIYYSLGGRALTADVGEPAEDANPDSIGKPPDGIAASLFLIAAGLALLVAGGRTTVSGATGLAAGFGVADHIIALTLVAVGTSLPELATSIIAAVRGHTDMAVGNVVGSNIFNLGFVLGAVALIRPLSLPAGGWADLWMMTALAATLLPLAWSHQLRLVRWEGGMLLIAYAAYLILRI